MRHVASARGFFLLLGWYLRPAAQIDVKGAHVAQDTPDIRFWLNPASECVTAPAENFFMERVPFWARLRNAQREDVRMFARRRGLLVAHPCSGGKTALKCANDQNKTDVAAYLRSIDAPE